MLIKELSGIRERNASGTAVKQFAAKVFLQSSNRFTDGWLTDIKFFRRFGNITGSGDSLKDRIKCDICGQFHKKTPFDMN